MHKLKEKYFTLNNCSHLVMECVYLWGTAQLLKPWNQIGHHYPIPCSTLIFLEDLLFITATTKNLDSEICHQKESSAISC